MKLLQEVVLIDGLSRTGKSLLSPIIGVFEEVEQVQFFNYLEHIIPGVYLNQVDQNFAKFSILKLLNEKIYDISIGRNINFRDGDQTSVVNHRLYEAYRARQKFKEGSEAIDLLHASSGILPIQTHDILTNGVILDSLDLGIKIIEILRNPIEVVDSWYRKGWGTRFLDDPQSFTLLTKTEFGFVPWFANHEPDLYLRSSPMDRCIMNVTYLYGNLFKEYYRYPQKLILPISYDNVILNPEECIDQISNFLGKTKIKDYSKALKIADLPRELDIKNREMKNTIISASSTRGNFARLQKCVTNFSDFLTSLNL
jgi:hypothetical protein